MAEPEQRPEGAWGLEYVPLNEMLHLLESEIDADEERAMA